MLRIKNHKQQELFDPWAFLSPKRRKMLEHGWPGLFKTAILPELPVMDIAPFFKTDLGRPTKELYSAIGVTVLQQVFDLTDEEAVDQLSFNIQWHYALNINEESDSAKYMCPKTLWNIRTILIKNELEQTIFNTATSKLADIFNVNSENQRIDSVHIKSNMKRLGRISIMASGINKFLRNVKRQDSQAFNAISADLIETYLKKKSLECFSMVKPSQAQKTLAKVSNDLFDLVQLFKSESKISDMHSYKQLERILKEQCNITESETGNKVEIKAPKEIPSDSLQNPSDPDASYSGHKGQGYQVQVMETYTDAPDKDEKNKTLNLITHIEVEPAHKSDANALIPAIESTQKQNLAPKEILADSLYNSDENQQQAEQHDIKVVAPVMGKTKQPDTIQLSEFTCNKANKVLSCPQGHTPVIVKQKKERHCASFDLEHCSGCPNQESCPVKKGKQYYYLRYSDREMRVSQRRAYEQSEEFKDRYRWRAGVEATMSEYDRKTGVKKLRVRGYRSVRFCAILKGLGINLLRAVAVLKAKSMNNDANGHTNRDQHGIIFVFKEQIRTILDAVWKIFNKLNNFKKNEREGFENILNYGI